MARVNIDDEHCHHGKRISWSAILAGALVGVGLSFLLNLFGMAIGLSAFSMSEHGVSTLAIGGLLGLIISTIIAMFFAGFTSGYIGRLYVPKHNMGAIYGFTTWSVALILAAVLTTYMSSYLNSYSTNVTKNTIVIAQEQPAKAKASTKAVDEDQQKIASISTKEATDSMAAGAFIVFALFFVGAFSSCLGAHYGMSCKSDE